jgi:hypothetical protein
MSATSKNIAMVRIIGMILSLAVIGPATAFGKGNKRTGNPARSQGTSINRRGVSPTSTGLRSATSGTRSLLHGDFSTFGSNVRTNPGYIDASNIYGSADVRARRALQPQVRGFKTMSGMDSETEVVARPGQRNR